MANRDIGKQTGSLPLPAAEAVRSELARLLADELFVNSPTLIRFLEYTVAEALDGRGDQLKESLLGREVFGRGVNFDPRIDPIVRVQAGKLRAKLADYYRGRGSADPIRIEFPKGGYGPHFVPLERDSEKAELPGAPRPEPAPAGPAQTVSSATPGRRLSRIAILAAAGVALAALIAWLWVRSRAVPEPKITLTQLTFEAGSAMNPAISRDGRLLAYSSDRGRGDLNIWIRPIEGGVPAQLTHDEAADHSPDFSPDGTWVVFRSHRQGGGIYAIPVFGGEERRIAGEGWAPRFSPDGAWIAYLGPGRSVFVVPTAGGQPRKVAGGEVEALAGPIWTPDGTHLIFLGAARSGESAARQYDWHSVNWTGGAPARVGLGEQLRTQGLPEPGSDTRPGDWLGDSIVFSLRRGKAASIWKAPVNMKTLRLSGRVEQLTAGTAAETFPRCSASGRMVLTSEDQLTHIFSLQLDQRTGEALGSPQQLTSDSSLTDDRTHPRISAKGAAVAFVSSRSGTQELLIKDLASGRESPLAATPRQERLPLISGDESLLVYGSQGGAAQAIYAVEPEKPFAQRICDGCGRVLDWSRDGHKVLLEGASRRAIELWDRDAGKRVELISYPTGTLSQATLSADRNWLALVFSSPPGAFVAPLASGPVPREALVPIPAGTDLGTFQWSPDGNVLYFFSRLDDYRCLWGQRLDARTKRPAGKPFSVQHFHSNRLSPWGSWISVGAGRMVFMLTEPRSNVWMATLGAGQAEAPGAALR